VRHWLGSFGQNRRAALVGFVRPKSSGGMRWVRSAKNRRAVFVGFVWSKIVGGHRSVGNQTGPVRERCSARIYGECRTMPHLRNVVNKKIRLRFITID
jgi:hypothetical protein